MYTAYTVMRESTLTVENSLSRVLYIAYIDSLYDTLNTHSFMILNGMFFVDEKDGQSENEIT